MLSEEQGRTRSTGKRGRRSRLMLIEEQGMTTIIIIVFITIITGVIPEGIGDGHSYFR